jgi:hypothetical protein
MAQQTINIGTAPNDGTGTPLRTSFDYCNLNFTELYTAVGPSGNNIVVPGTATITGDLTVDTSTLKVDSANDRVGIGITSPLAKLDIRQPAAVEALKVYLNDTGSTNIVNFKSFDNVGGEVTRFAIAANGVATWSYVGGVAGTAMTLNSTGLAIGTTVTNRKLTIGGAASNALIHFFNTATGSANTDGFTFGLETDQSVVLFNAENTAMKFYTNSVQAMTLDASGNLLVGKTASSTTVAGSQVQPDGTFSAVKTDANPGLFYNTTTAISGTIALFRSNGVTVGSISQDGTNTAYNNSSDYRLKESVQPLTGGLDRVNALKPSIYKWKTNGKVGEGFLAHELAEVVPFAVTGEKDAVTKDGEIEPQQVDLSKVVPILVAAIKELSAEVNALKNA